jgi:hypothetical protein
MLTMFLVFGGWLAGWNRAHPAWTAFAIAVLMGALGAMHYAEHPAGSYGTAVFLFTAFCLAMGMAGYGLGLLMTHLVPRQG